MTHLRLKYLFQEIRIQPEVENGHLFRAKQVTATLDLTVGMK